MIFFVYKYIYYLICIVTNLIESIAVYLYIQNKNPCAHPR